MSETIIAAIIGLGGAIIVAICGVIAQISITRKVIQAEREKVLLQIAKEDDIHRDSRKKDQILEALSELLAITDPDNANSRNLGKTASLICRLQLLLDRNVPIEKELNGALNKLGFHMRGDAELAGIEHNRLYLHSQVIDLGAEVVRSIRKD